MRIEFNRILKGMVAVLPEYQDGVGKVSKVYLRDGSISMVSVSVRYVIERYFEYNLVSLGGITNISRNILNKTADIPLVSKGEMFLPVKAHEKRIKGDRVFGLVNYNEVLLIKDGIIYLKSGQTIKSFDSAASLQRRIGQGSIVLNYVENNKKVKEQERMKEIQKQYDDKNLLSDN